MIKNKLHLLLVGFFGLALFACEPTESDYVSPTSSSDNQLSFSRATSVGEEELCSEAYVIPLQFDGGVAGNVSISNDATNLYVTIFSTDGFQNISENVALWVGTDLNDLELNSYGIPLNSTSYDYLDQAVGTEYTFTVPLADIAEYNVQECGVQSIYVVTSVKVLVETEGGTFYGNAYGGNILVETSFFWWYDSYTPQCCEEKPPVDGRCETAYAKFPIHGDFGNGYIFASHNKANPDGHLSLDLSNNQWGWSGRFTEDGTYEFDLYGGAALNDISKGALVGTVTVEISGNDVKVTYDIASGFSMEELHIYVSNSAPTTTAPGQYGYTREFDEPQTSHVAEFTVDGGYDIWVIAHASVCGDYPELTEEEEE